jgi:hypothetical protein
MSFVQKGTPILAAVVLAAVLAGCGASDHVPPTAAPATTAPKAPAPTPTTRRTTPPTTEWKLTSPQPGPQEAAAALVAAWAAGNRAAATQVAVPAAVKALFSVAYPGAGLTTSRGCSTQFPPIVCTYGPPGGGSPNDPVFEVYLKQAAPGWYVSSVTPET